MTTDDDDSRREATRGFFYALASYVMWGFLPLYMKAVAHLPLMEVIAHRIIWSLPLAGILLVAMGRTSDIRAAFANPRQLLMAALTAAIIAINWCIYVWSIMAGRTVEAALGYYINPLVSMALGALLLSERFSRPQLVAIGLAVSAVAVLTVANGGLPWVSLTLAFSFAAYGYFRKTLPLGPSQGFFLEVLILLTPALAYVGWLIATGASSFTLDRPRDISLLLFAGPVTAIPLILFAAGARRLRMSTIGIMQYVAPTLIGGLGVFVFDEPFGPERMAAFVLIWAALAVYSWSMLNGRAAVTDVR